GSYSPEMATAMDRLPRANIQDFDHLKNLWTSYSRLTPKQHETMNAALDTRARHFINVYALASDLAHKDDPSTKMPAIKRVTANGPLTQQEQAQLKIIANYIANSNEPSLSAMF